jgi:hypothetical protein
MAGGGEYEPKDSRNVTGTASTPDGRWTNPSANPPNAAGAPEEPDEDLDESIVFEPDPALLSRIEKAEADRRKGGRETKH